MSIANSSYPPLKPSRTRRFGAGFSVLGSFTWSKVLDLASNDGGGGLGNQASNPFRYSRDKGPADFDVERRFVTSFLWEMPFFRGAGNWRRAVLGGWQLNGILTLPSGLPFSVTAGTDPPLAGGGGGPAGGDGGARTLHTSPPPPQRQKGFSTCLSSP